MVKICMESRSPRCGRPHSCHGACPPRGRGGPATLHGHHTGGKPEAQQGRHQSFLHSQKPSQCLLCAVTVTVAGDAFKGQRGCKFTGHSSLLAGPASTESEPTAQKLCTKTQQGTKHKFQVYASSSNSKCVSATSKHTSLVDVASCTLAQLRSGLHFQAYRPGMRCRYNRNTCQA